MTTSKSTATARRPTASKPSVATGQVSPTRGPQPRRAPEPAPAPIMAPPAAAPAPSPVVAEGPRLIDDPHAPEFFATSCCGFSIGQGHVTLTFESARCNHFDPNCSMNRVVVGRIVLPVQAAQALVIELNNSLQRSGFNPSRAATAGMIPQ